MSIGTIAGLPARSLGQKIDSEFNGQHFGNSGKVVPTNFSQCLNLRYAVIVVSFQLMKNEDNMPRVKTVIPQFVYPKPMNQEDEGGLLPTQGMQLSSPTPSHLDERPLWLNKKLWLRKEFWQGVAAGVGLGIIVMGLLANRYTVVSVGSRDYSIKLDRWTGQAYSVGPGVELKNDQR